MKHFRHVISFYESAVFQYRVSTKLRLNLDFNVLNCLEKYLPSTKKWQALSVTVVSNFYNHRHMSQIDFYSVNPSTDRKSVLVQPYRVKVIDRKNIDSRYIKSPSTFKQWHKVELNLRLRQKKGAYQQMAASRQSQFYNRQKCLFCSSWSYSVCVTDAGLPNRGKN